MALFKNKYNLPLELTSILFGIILTLIFGWFHAVAAIERMDEFERYHHLISDSATKNIRYEIERILQHKNKLVRSFFEDNETIITEVANNPENDALYHLLNTKLKRYFTDYFASNIVSQSGELIIDDFDGNIGPMCLNDMQYFVTTNQQITRIHPNPSIYHYDVRAKFTDGSNRIFIVTFNTNEISSLIKASTPAKHDIIIFNNKVNIIEITRHGSRNKLQGRLDYRLSENEKSRRLSSSKVNNSYWDVTDLHDATLFIDYNATLIRESVITYVFFIVLISSMSFALFIGSRNKNRLENYLITKNKNIDILNKKLRVISQTDSLTKMFNRRYMDSRSLSDFSTAQRLSIPLSISLIDIDYFKRYNDTYGHQLGDDCLIEVSNIISGYFKRSNEFSARYGGEEFVVMNLGDYNFNDRIDELLSDVESHKIPHSESDVSDFVTVSIGVAVMIDDSHATIHELIKAADDALYQAKNAGRNKVVLASLK